MPTPRRPVEIRLRGVTLLQGAKRLQQDGKRLQPGAKAQMDDSSMGIGRRNVKGATCRHWVERHHWVVRHRHSFGRLLLLLLVRLLLDHHRLLGHHRAHRR